MQSVLVVDSDERFASSIVDRLHQDGYDAQWRKALEVSAVQQFVEASEPHPLAIIFDPGNQPSESWHLYRQFKELEDPPQLILVSDNTSALDRQQAYANGVDNILPKSADITDLSAAVKRAELEREQRHELQRQVVLARSAAFVAMSTSSRVGQVVRFMQTTMEAQTPADIAHSLFEIAAGMSLFGLLKVQLGKEPEYFSDRNTTDSDEIQLLEGLGAGQRITESQNNLIIRDAHCALLIRNLPLDDLELRGQLRDDLCILVDAIESRCKVILVERQAEKQRQLLQTSLRVLDQIVADADAFNLEFTQQSESIIDEMILEMNAEFSAVNLNEAEESRLIGFLDTSSQKLSVLFDQKRDRDQIVHEILSKLLAMIAV